MSSEVAIRAEELSKRYLIGATHGMARYRTLREDITSAASLKRTQKEQEAEFWALRDLSFEIMAGETVGIIGRNGAGKSTLLKLLAGITPPTSGRGETFGRVASLLEVGTGFHPELSGRENIMLSAAIMGMRRSEILARFDEIVDFAGMEKFLDTPVKRYSSGMYMRLAFSVAAHLDPEILLVDEVLAVGDAEFQRKCLGRMEELSGTGRTVVFVSHSMPSILRLCPRVLLLDGGVMTADGTGMEVIETYMGRGSEGASRSWIDSDTAPGDELAQLAAIRVLDAQNAPVTDLDIRENAIVEVEYLNLSGRSDFHPSVVLHVYNAEGVLLFISADFNIIEWRTRPRHRGRVRAKCQIPGNFLSEGGLFIDVAIATVDPFRVHARALDAVAFHVVDHSAGDGVRGEWVGDYPGALRPMLQWSVDEDPS